MTELDQGQFDWQQWSPGYDTPGELLLLAVLDAEAAWLFRLARFGMSDSAGPLLERRERE